MTRQGIVITGAGSDIGRATAQTFLQAGWRVALIGRREDALRETAGDSDALVVPCDVAAPDQVEAAFARVAGDWGRIDALFNNAGVSLPGKPIDEIAVEDWLRLCSTNITGMFLCARAAFGIMRRQEPSGGRIINNGSISAHAPRPGSAPYTMSKHAVTGLTKTLSLDGRPWNIACGQIDIGNAATEMTDRMTAGVLQPRGDKMVEPRMDVANVADAIVFMATRPLDANALFLNIMATKMPFVGRG